MLTRPHTTRKVRPAELRGHVAHHDFPLSTAQGRKSPPHTSTPAVPASKDPLWDTFSAVRIALLIYAIAALTYFSVF